MIKRKTDNGFFIAVDGPNGAGKTTIIQSLVTHLSKQGYDLYVTCEPTDSDFGKYLRTFAEQNSGISVACMVAADRYEHLKKEIIPALSEGKIVITDRYILSSLILQVMDGVSAEYVMSVNSEIIAPDLQLAVFADEDTLQKRLSERSELTRFEKECQSSNELLFMKKGLDILESEGINILSVNNVSALSGNVNKVASYVMDRWSQ